MNENFDVIVVGAGPAGISVADRCAEHGLKVIALEKDLQIGAPVRCGEGLGLGWFKRLNLPPNKDFAVQEIFGAVLYSPSEKKIEIRSDKVNGYIIERKAFEKFLARNAARKGAKFLTKTTVFDLIKEDNKIIGVKANFLGEEKEFYANVIVGADGVESTIARLAGLKTTNVLYHMDSGLQYEMAGIELDDPNMIHLFFGEKIAPRGYVWIFPKGKDYANVGIGISASNEKTARYYLDKWIKEHPKIRKGAILEVNCGGIPVGGFLEKMTSNNLIVVGDAAHQVNPIHGGGMGIAIEAGRLAADVIKEAHEKEDFSDESLSIFNQKWFELRGNELKIILRKRQMFEKLSDQDFETLASAFTGEEIQKLVSKDLVQSAAIVTKKLIKHPRLAALLLKYLKA
jgi:digeranylgeranylglycerophospholipid reductase